MDKNNCGCTTENGQCHADGLLETLREIDFVIVETTLYLDVYPNCRAAREYLADMRRKRAKVAAEYESKHGMLTLYGVCGESSDVRSPWPWEYAAN